ncbi:MAG: hypothetical protein EBR82_07955 [Caulobacteraceae bacterium]|nr:hypothetical protein [Caulobacteraceae bacterium]
MSEKKPNLWWRWIADYWSDPRKVFEAQRVEDMWRKFFKLCWILGSVYILFWVAGPTNVKALQLWMEDDALAAATAWAMTWMSFLAFSIVRYASAGLAPITFYIPLIPRKWHAEPLSLPSLSVLMGSVLVLALLYVQFTNAFNMYAHEALKSGGAATTQLSAASSEVADLEAALRQVNEGERATLARIDADLSRVAPEKTLTIRTLGAQRQDAVDKAAAERRRIQAELKEARRTNVATTQTVSDPRPVDGYYAAALGIERTLMSALNDAQRSALVELLLVMGLGLGLVAATSKLGVREAAELKATTEPEAAPEEKAPEDKASNVTPFPGRKKFLLPAGVGDYVEEAA